MRRAFSFLIFALLFSINLFSCPPLPYRFSIIWNGKGKLVKDVPKSLIAQLRKNFNLDHLNIRSNGLAFHLKLPSIEKRKYQFINLATSVDFSRFFTETGKFLNCSENKSIYDCAKKGEVIKLIQKYDRNTYQEVAQFYKRVKGNFQNWGIKWDKGVIIKFEARYPKVRTKEEAMSALFSMQSILKSYVRGAEIPATFGEGKTEFEVFHLEQRWIVPENIRDYDYGNTIVHILKSLLDENILKGLSEEDLAAIKSKAGNARIVFYRAKGCPPIGVSYLENEYGWIGVENNYRINIYPKCPKCPEIFMIRR